MAPAKKPAGKQKSPPKHPASDQSNILQPAAPSIPVANKPDYEWYHNLIKILRRDKDEARRIMHGLESDDRRTLKRDIKTFENRRSTINDKYLIRIYAHRHGGFKSGLYLGILQRLFHGGHQQTAIQRMCGEYKVYRLATVGTGESMSHAKIDHIDGVYNYADKSTQLGMEFDYAGYAFLVRRRVYLLQVLPAGIRMTILNYVSEPAKQPIQGIQLSVRFKEDLSEGEKEDIFAARQLFIHKDHPWYNTTFTREQIEGLIKNPEDITGFILA